MSEDNPFGRFKTRLGEFAAGRHGIRNPFVIVPVQPTYEWRVAERLADWADDPHESDAFPEDGTVQLVALDELVVETDVFDLALDLGDNVAPAAVEEMMQDQLATELVDELLDEIEAPDRQSHVVVLVHLGSLYPFTRASELLDELDRRNVRSTVGIPFPGDVVGGRLSFFGEESRTYYPAHQIDDRIEEVHLQ